MSYDESGNWGIYIGLAILAMVVLVFVAASNPMSYISNEDPINVININQTGIEGNVWNDTFTGIDTPSNVVDTKNFPHLSIMGGTSGATTLSVYVSQDGTNFYLCEDLTTKINNPSGLTFHIYFTAGARYYYLTSSSNVTANTTISGKP